MKATNMTTVIQHHYYSHNFLKTSTITGLFPCLLLPAHKHKAINIESPLNIDNPTEWVYIYISPNIFINHQGWRRHGFRFSLPQLAATTSQRQRETLEAPAQRSQEEEDREPATIVVGQGQTMTGSWLTYPSEKYESQMGWLFPIN